MGTITSILKHGGSARADHCLCFIVWRNSVPFGDRCLRKTRRNADGDCVIFLFVVVYPFNPKFRDKRISHFPRSRHFIAMRSALDRSSLAVSVLQLVEGLGLRFSLAIASQSPAPSFQKPARTSGRVVRFDASAG